MSFHAHLEDVRAQTGKNPEQLKALAVQAGIYKPDMKASTLVAWLKDEFALGHDHAMTIWTFFKDKGWVDPPRRPKS